MVLSFDAAYKSDDTKSLFYLTSWYQFGFDICFSINIALNFITAYQQDIEWKFNLKDIAKAYIKSFFFFDVISTFPLLFTYDRRYYALKILRYARFRGFINQINQLLYKLFNRIGLNKQVIERIFYFLSLLIYLIFIIHILASSWIYIGIVTKESWLRGYPLSNGKFKNVAIPATHKSKIYIHAVYWVITTLTTVGYGDIIGASNTEHIFQMGVEFIGIGFFSFLMGSINNIIVQESKLQDIIDERIEDLEIWLRRLDKSRANKQLPSGLYDSIKEYVEASFLLDFNLIQTYEFFDQLKPKLKYKLINELEPSKRILNNFYYMFEDDEFDAG